VARPKIEELRYVTTEIAKQAIEWHAAPEQRRAIMATLQDWFPDADEFDLRWAADGVALGLTQMMVLREKRRLRMVEDGKTRMPGADGS
jgi:hypothetical protein